MFVITCAVLLLSLVPNQGWAIVNGEDASIGDFPYQVSIQKILDGKHFCSGTIINEYFILTAAHCLEEKAEDIQVAAGMVDLTHPKVIHRVMHMVMHEMYNKTGSYFNDIGLIKVHSPIQFHATITAAELPNCDWKISSNTRVWESGWGRIIGPDSPTSVTLKKVHTKVIDLNECIRLYSRVLREISPEQICTHFIGEKRKGGCTFDSGGPVVKENNMVIGIISWALKDPDCASPKFPDVHTRISAYIDWIGKNSKLEKEEKTYLENEEYGSGSNSRPIR